MGGWLVQVPVKRFGTEATDHLYAGVAARSHGRSGSSREAGRIG